MCIYNVIGKREFNIVFSKKKTVHRCGIDYKITILTGESESDNISC